jgi:hypothetical protein
VVELPRRLQQASVIAHVMKSAYFSAGRADTHLDRWGPILRRRGRLPSHHGSAWPVTYSAQSAVTPDTVRRRGCPVLQA